MNRRCGRCWSGCGRTALGAYAHQDLPFERLVEELSTERDRSRDPLVQVVCALDTSGSGLLELTALSIEPLAVKTRTAKFDLALFMHQAGTEISGVWIYRRELFESATIRRMRGHLQRLLEGIVADPTAPIRSLAWLSPEEEQQRSHRQNELRQSGYAMFKRAKRTAVVVSQ